MQLKQSAFIFIAERTFRMLSIKHILDLFVFMYSWGLFFLFCFCIITANIFFHVQSETYRKNSFFSISHEPINSKESLYYEEEYILKYI